MATDTSSKDTSSKPFMTMMALAGFWLTVVSAGSAQTPANDNAPSSGDAPSGTPPRAV
jgi:hypothetical protein